MDAMNGIETTRGEAGKVDKEIENESRKRRAYLFPKCYPKNAFQLSESFVPSAIERGKSDLALFRYNVQYVCYVKRMPLTQVVSQMNKQGIKIFRGTITMQGLLKHTFPKSLLLSTFALALGVPTWLLLSDNIESDCERLKIF